MTLSELLEHLSSIAAKYRTHAASHIALNSEMTGYTGEPLEQEVVDAVLSNFLCFVGASWGVPFDLCAKDFPLIEAQGVVPLQVGANLPAEKKEENRIIVP